MALEDCPWCGASNVHYMMHVCPGCVCHVTEARIPGEPQMGSYLEMEPNPYCTVHFPDGPDETWELS